MHRRKRAKLPVLSLFSGLRGVNLSDVVGHSFQQELRPAILSKGKLPDWINMGKRRTHIRGTMRAFCANQTSSEPKGLKQLDAIQATGSNSTCYGEVPADWRLARSKRENKSVEELVKQDQGCIICLAAQHGAAGAGWSKYSPLELGIYLNNLSIIYSPTEGGLTTSTRHLRIQGLRRTETLSVLLSSRQEREVTSKSQVHSSTFTSPNQQMLPTPHPTPWDI